LFFQRIAVVHNRTECTNLERETNNNAGINSFRHKFQSMPSIYIICTIISTVIEILDKFQSMLSIYNVYFFCSSRRSTVECTTEPPIHAYTTMRKARYEGKT
jgi:hypothetical protein